MADVKKLTVVIDGESHKLSQSTKKATDDLKGLDKATANISNQLKNIGKGMAAGFAISGIASFFAGAVSDGNNLELVIAKIEQGVRQTGKAAGYSSEELQKMASKLESKSIYAATDILDKVTGNLLTFPAVSGKVFDQAQKSILDYASVLKMDLQGATIQVAKALQDPIAGINAMARSGVSFSAQQKEMIKMMVETGDVAGAQTMILKTLNEQYGGQALAATQTAAGQLEQFKVQWGNLKETIGMTIMKGIVKPVEAMNSIITKSNKTIFDWTNMLLKATAHITGFSEGQAIMMEYQSLFKQVKDGTISAADATERLNLINAKKNKLLGKEAEITNVLTDLNVELETGTIATTEATKVYTGTLAQLEKQIESLKESQKNVTNPQEWAALEEQIKGINYEMEVFKAGGIDKVMSDIGNSGIKPVELDIAISDDMIEKIDEAKLKMMELKTSFDYAAAAVQIFDDAVTSALGDSIDALFESATEGGEKFGKRMQGIFFQLVKDIMKAIVKMVILNAITGGTGSVVSGLGGIAGNLFKGGGGGNSSNALGNSFGSAPMLGSGTLPSQVTNTPKIVVEGKINGNDINWSNKRQIRTNADMGI